MRERFPTQGGLALVEMMVALVLGLLVIEGVAELFLSSREVYRQTENLARLQENGRYALEVMTRDLREAGGIACGSDLPTANVLNGATGNWWSNWSEGIHGYEGDENSFPRAFGSGEADRASGTDAVVVHSGTANDGILITDHDPLSAQFKVNTTAHGIVDGDVLLVCDYRQAAVFQATNANASSATIVHQIGATVAPGNCSKGLGFPTECTTNGTSYSFQQGGVITKLSAQAWYVGHNGRGGTSLYRLNLENNVGNAQTAAEEMVEGVADLQVQYLTQDNSGALAPQYVDASLISDWTKVVAARLTFTLQTLERVGTDLQAIQRRWYTVVSLRNRLP